MSTKANIVIEQGCDFAVPITLTDQNGEPLITTSFVANGEIRQYYDATTAYPLTLTLANGSLIVAMDAASSANIAAGRYVYDVILTDTTSNTISRLIEGICTITPSVTHA